MISSSVKKILPWRKMLIANVDIISRWSKSNSWTPGSKFSSSFSTSRVYIGSWATTGSLNSTIVTICRQKWFLFTFYYISCAQASWYWAKFLSWHFLSNTQCAKNIEKCTIAGWTDVAKVANLDFRYNFRFKIQYLPLWQSI